MSPTNVIICKSKQTKSSVEHYYNTGHRSNQLVSSNPNIGIKNAIISISNGVLNRSFTRDNTNNANNYFQITNSTKSYIIVAAGQLNSNGNLMFHSINGISSTLQTFSQSSASTTLATKKTTKSTTKKTTKKTKKILMS